MPQSAQEWYDAMRSRIDAQGYRSVKWSERSTWPFQEGPGEPHDLAQLGAERRRHGADGVDCFMCAAVATSQRNPSRP